jgi:hypothetical protein
VRTYTRTPALDRDAIEHDARTAIRRLIAFAAIFRNELGDALLEAASVWRLNCIHFDIASGKWKRGIL